jgi:hypothetical protein
MRRHPTLMVILIVLGSIALAACGSSKKKSSSSTASTPSQQATTLSISVSASGKKASYSAPATTKGGLVTVTLQNNGKAPHGAQLVKIDGNHSPAEVLKAVGGNSNKTPSWIHGEGGPGNTNPGQTSTSTDILQAGNYLIIDSGMNGPPSFRKLTVTTGPSGSLPSTGTSLTAASPAKDKYKWQISGPLNAGQNRITFASKGNKKDAIHLIAAARVTGNPSKAQILKGLARNGPPPKFVDRKSFTSTSVLDAGKSEVTSLSLTKPGEYVIFCPLTDRDGGKPHLAEGLLTTVNVK